VGKDCGKCNKEVSDLLKRGTELPVATNQPNL
jgi:hypothetical protein